MDRQSNSKGNRGGGRGRGNNPQQESQQQARGGGGNQGGRGRQQRFSQNQGQNASQGWGRNEAPKPQGRTQKSQQSQQGAWGRNEPPKRQTEAQGAWAKPGNAAKERQEPTGGAWGRSDAPRGPPSSTGVVPKMGLQPVCSTGVAPIRPPVSFTEGRASVHREPSSTAEGPVVSEQSRGAVRGKRIISEIIRTRPRNCVSKAGTSGRKIVVQTNYFAFLKRPDWTIHQYRVDFSPEVEIHGLRRAYLGQYQEKFGGYLFDGTVIFSTTFLGDKPLEFVTKSKIDESPVQIIVKRVGAVDSSDSQFMQVLNLILRRAMVGLQLSLVGRNFFDSGAKVVLPNYKLEIWPGYQTSIRQHECDILLNAEIAHKVTRTDSIYHILRDIMRENRGGTDVENNFRHAVIGMIVLTDYNNKTYRVDDISFDETPASTFPTKDGREMNYVNYYQARYKIKITDLNQPLLISRPTEKNIRGGNDQIIKLIPSLCRATGLSDEMRSNFRLMRAMSDQTRLNPELRIQRLEKFNDRLQTSPGSIATLKAWNIKLDTKLVEVPARVLAPERILFGNMQSAMPNQFADWGNEFKSKQMYTVVEIRKWTVVTPRKFLREIDNFVGLCVKVARNMKMRIENPEIMEMENDRTTNYNQVLEVAARKDPQLIMVLLPNNGIEKYSCVKKKLCVDRPVPSQVVVLNTIAPRAERSGGLMSIATKVVIQMNAKLGGAPWMLDIPLSGLMTVGFDVCHSSKDKNKSYGALVATMNLKQSCRYYSAVSPHTKGQELSSQIAIHFVCALKAYRAQHGTLPERIIFYRDGVGDGQLHQVLQTELEFVRKQIDEIYKASTTKDIAPRLAVIIVSKRINTRLFSNGRNPEPGTVVDDIITLPERYDFFLVSQSVRQGTVSPTSYNVIYDTMGLDANRLQMLTYKMTHLYYNWSGTLRVPAVCQYAHKLAFLIAESVCRSPDNALESQLYFL